MVGYLVLIFHDAIQEGYNNVVMWPWNGFTHRVRGSLFGHSYKFIAGIMNALREFMGFECAHLGLCNITLAVWTACILLFVLLLKMGFLSCSC